MKVPDIFAAAKQTQFSFELLPPLKGTSIEQLYAAIDPLLAFNPAYINITAHREQIEYKKLPNGLLEERTVRKRPGNVAIAGALQHKYGIPVVPHILCGGFSKSETEYALIELHFLGIRNILALRGDALKSEAFYKPHPQGHEFTSQLISQAKNLGKGNYLDEELENSTPLDFSIGVAGYPEKHYSAPNLAHDLLMLKAKVAAGADYVVTQMFFDNQKYFDFVNAARAIGITVPIVPGIKPLAMKTQLERLPQIFYIDLPEDLAAEVRKAKDNPAVYQIGIEWAIAQSK
ncbi:MAG: hypothetical protein RIS47_1500, partial [Bacteroidota bacterium]